MDNKKMALKKELIYHINKYYSLQPGEKTELSDEQYDSLIEKFLSLGGTREELPLGEKGDFKHTYKVKSLGKVNEIKDLQKIMNKLQPGIIEPKFDGLTLVHYRKLGKIITRGDGDYGKDITDKAIKIPSIKNVIEKYNNFKDDYIIRGEGIISKANFKIINDLRVSKGLERYKNARNAISGILQGDDETNLIYIDFFVYNIMGSKAKETEQLKLLEQLGYKATGYYNYSYNNLDNAIAWVEVFNKNSAPYEIDGLVIKTDINNSLKIFGETAHHPKNAIAYKFPPQGEWTKLNEVTWHVGRTGKVVPVGHFNKIDLFGSTISKATLHNSSYIKLLDLKLDDAIFVIKANDVIPRILKNKMSNSNKEIIIPSVCPICNSQLKLVNKDLYCENDLCIAKIVKRTVHLCQALEIKEINLKTIEKLYDMKLIKQPYDIFNLTVNDFMMLEGYSNKSSNKAYKNIQNKKFVPFDKFLYGCGIPLIGEVTAQDIASHFGKFSIFLTDLMFDCNEIKSIKNIGDSIIASLKNNINLIKNYMLFINPLDVAIKKKDIPLLKIVITGKIQGVSRKKIVEELKKYNCNIVGTVSNNTDFILCDDLDCQDILIDMFHDIEYENYDRSQINLVSASKKIRDGVALDIPIVKFKDLLKILKML